MFLSNQIDKINKINEQRKNTNDVVILASLDNNEIMHIRDTIREDIKRSKEISPADMEKILFDPPKKVRILQDQKFLNFI